ncbi:MAG: DUF3352 domain-containing protein [Verrucomicrobia bacterium]|nr:DUF3352 domain-containing protein [Verrucomicrobiota bacterium]
MRKNPLISLTLAWSVLAVVPLAQPQDLPPANQWIPEEAVAVIELARPEALLDPLLSQDLARALGALPVWQQRTATPKYREFMAVLGYLEGQLSTDWRTAARKLIGDGVTLALGPQGEILLAVDARDGNLLDQLHQILRGFAVAEAAKQGQADRVTSVEYRGVTGHSFGPKEAHAILGRRLLVANQPKILKYVVDLKDDPQGRHLAASPLYQGAARAAGKGAVATAFVNLQALRDRPGLQQALTAASNPLATLLLAGTREALKTANWLSLGMYLEGGRLILKAATDGQPPAPAQSAAFATPREPGTGALPNLAVPGAIAGLSLYRDLHGFYAAKNVLFPERTSGLIFFENMMGIFFSGLDLTEQVFGETRPEIRLVVAAQRYDPAIGTPAVQWPAFAAILRLRRPAAFGEVVEEAWQKAIGLVNFTQGQQANPGLILDRFAHRDTKGTVAYYRPPAASGQAPIDARYNFRPALARPGDYLILSSTDGLARQLIDALDREQAAPGPARPVTHTLLELEGAQLRAILAANFDHLVRKNMVDKGTTQPQAEAELGMLLTLLDCVGAARLDLGRPSGPLGARLELELKLPTADPPKPAQVNAGAPPPPNTTVAAR